MAYLCEGGQTGCKHSQFTFEIITRKTKLQRQTFKFSSFFCIPSFMFDRLMSCRRDGSTTHTYEPQLLSQDMPSSRSTHLTLDDHTSMDCNEKQGHQKLKFLSIHGQPLQTFEWIHHLKLCVVLHEPLFSTQRYRCWICAQQPLSRPVPLHT